MSGSKTAVVLGISFAADLVGFVNFWDRGRFRALSARRLRERKRIVKETSLLAESGDGRRVDVSSLNTHTKKLSSLAIEGRGQEVGALRA